MRQGELIEIYGRVRTALLIAAPVAVWGFMYWLSNGEMIPALAFGGSVILPMMEAIPSADEVRHKLIAESKRTENIWFRMI